MAAQLGRNLHGPRLGRNGQKLDPPRLPPRAKRRKNILLPSPATWIDPQFNTSMQRRQHMPPLQQPPLILSLSHTQPLSKAGKARPPDQCSERASSDYTLVLYALCQPGSGDDSDASISGEMLCCVGSRGGKKAESGLRQRVRPG